MSFWSTSDGTAITPEKEYKAAGGNFEPLPKNTKVLALVEDAYWKAGYEVAEEFIEICVRVLKPETYADRKLRFKLWADELDPTVVKKDGEEKAKNKRDSHKKMLGTIDANNKGRLAKNSARPTDEQLKLALINSQFVATLDVWEQNGKSGNWLRGASPKDSEVTEVASKARPKPAVTMFDDDDDAGVPF